MTSHTSSVVPDQPVLCMVQPVVCMVQPVCFSLDSSVLAPQPH